MSAAVLTAEEIKHRAYALEQSALIRQTLKSGESVRVSVRHKPPNSDLWAAFTCHDSTHADSLNQRIRALMLAEADELERYALTGSKATP